MGFDVGAVLGNLLLAYFSQDGHAGEGDSRADYQEWILDTLESVWNGFAARFLALWRGEAAKGDAFPRDLFAEGSAAAALESERQAMMARLYADSIGFAAAKMIRRILGLAHIIDLGEDRRPRPPRPLRDPRASPRPRADGQPPPLRRHRGGGRRRARRAARYPEAVGARSDCRSRPSHSFPLAPERERGLG